MRGSRRWELRADVQNKRHTSKHSCSRVHAPKVSVIGYDGGRCKDGHGLGHDVGTKN